MPRVPARGVARRAELPCGHAMCSACFVSHVERGNGACHLCRAPLPRAAPPPPQARALRLDINTVERQVADVAAQHVLAQMDSLAELTALSRLSPSEAAVRLVRFLQLEYRLVMMRLLVRLEQLDQ